MIFSRANEKVMFISNLSIGPWGAGQDEAIYVITSHAYLKQNIVDANSTEKSNKVATGLSKNPRTYTDDK